MATASLFVPSRQEVILRLLKKVQELNAEVNALMATEYGVLSSKYAGMEIATALVKYLDSRGGEADYLECEQELISGGCDCGSRPRANIRTTVTRNPKLFEWRGTRVGRVREVPRMPVMAERVA